MFSHIQEQFSGHSNPEKAGQMSRYMKNLFPFYGISRPERNELIREWLKSARTLTRSEQWKLVDQLWNEPHREMHYTALDLLKIMMRKPQKEELAKVESLILRNSWWDSVDVLAPYACGTYFQAFPEERDQAVERYMLSGELWLMRTALLFQLFYKEKTDEKLLFDLCRQLSAEKEFFIRKAIGWSLRQYAKTNPEAVTRFVTETPLSGLSRREALKRVTGDG